MNRIAVILSFIALILSLVALVRSNNNAEKMKMKQGKAQVLVQSPEHSEHVEVAAYMADIQRFSNKLYSAAANGNNALVNFYLHEMEETMEDLIEEAPIEDGFDVAESMKVYGLKALETYATEFKSRGKDGAEDIHRQLVLSCNSCHAASGHPFLRMEVPANIDIAGQDMRPY